MWSFIQDIATYERKACRSIAFSLKNRCIHFYRKGNRCIVQLNRLNVVYKQPTVTHTYLYLHKTYLHLKESLQLFDLSLRTY